MTTARASRKPDRASVLQRGGRADEATPGHGLGLAMVHDTVALYGGTMRIDSFGVRRRALRAQTTRKNGVDSPFPSKGPTCGEEAAGARFNRSRSEHREAAQPKASCKIKLWVPVALSAQHC